MRKPTILLVLIALLAAEPQPLAAQIERTVIGAGIGVAGGAVITLSAIVARARLQREYVDSVDDLIHWQTIPMIAAPAAGMLFGLASEEALVGSIVGSSSGLLVGAAVGAGVGWVMSAHQEAPWAGGVIGAGVGLTLGGLGLGLARWRNDEEAYISFPDVLRFSISVPAP